MGFLSIATQIAFRYAGYKWQMRDSDPSLSVTNQSNLTRIKVDELVIDGDFIEYYGLNPKAPISTIVLNPWKENTSLNLRPKNEYVQLPIPYLTDQLPLEFLLHHHIRSITENEQRIQLHFIIFSVCTVAMPRLVHNLILNIGLSLFILQSLLKWTGLLDKFIDGLKHLADEKSPLETTLNRITNDGLRQALIYLSGQMLLDDHNEFKESQSFPEIKNPKSSFEKLYSDVRAKYLERGLPNKISEREKALFPSPSKRRL